MQQILQKATPMVPQADHRRAAVDEKAGIQQIGHCRDPLLVAARDAGNHREQCRQNLLLPAEGAAAAPHLLKTYIKYKNREEIAY